ncbi:YlxR family protein [Ureaplasma ceti]|uniref:YlxR domain-containing protein n=1 Tax=Ureaplasma ceti TaxID=3119530 RepID=A0ABP9U7K5_9BACT
MSKKRVINQRTCLLTRQKYLKPNLLRIVYLDQQVIVDVDQKLPARGYYVYPSAENYQKLVKTRLLNRIFKTNIDLAVYAKLEQYFK